MNNNKKIFYGWWIVAAAFMIMTLIYTPSVNLVSLFTVPITKDLGFGMSQFMLYITIKAIAAMVSAPIAARLMKRMDIRVYLTVFFLIAALSFVGFSFSTKLIHFYVFSILMGAGMAGGVLIPTSVLITNWFNEKRGLCLGIALSGSGFGGVILSPTVNWLITAYGWRSAYLVLGILVAVVLIPLALFVIRLHPADKGLSPLGEATSINRNIVLTGITQGQALKSISFWTLCLGIGVGGIVVNTMLYYLIPYLTGIGTTAKTAAWILSLSSVMVIVAKLLVGRLFDKIGLITTLFIISAASLVSFLFLMKANIVLAAILYTIFAGIGSTAVTITPPYMTGALFGHKEYGPIYGVVAMFITLGSAITPIVSGALYNINHSFELILDTLIILSIVQFALFYISSKTKPRLASNPELIEKEA